MDNLFSSVANLFSEFNTSPFKSWIDLNDLRNVLAILGAVIAIIAANKKWGNKAVYTASIQHRINRPDRVSNLSIANLKDKPLAIYEVLAVFPTSKKHFSLQRFDPPLVIKGLEATSFTPEDFSSMGLDTNPFSDGAVDMHILLITESSAVKCKAALPPSALIDKALRGFEPIPKIINKFNDKIYTSNAIYAIGHELDGKMATSFLLKNGLICDEWPHDLNVIPLESMKSDDLVLDAIAVLSEKLGIPLQILKL
jgi:hypothetical protein